MARLSKTGSKAGKAKARKAVQAKGRKNAKTKRQAAPPAKPRKRPSVSDLEAKLQIKAIELNEAQEQQAATAEILKIIASSPSDVQPVFEAVVNSAARLFEPCSATITTLKQGKLHWNAFAQIDPSFDHEAASAVYPIPFDPNLSPSAQAILERRIVAIPDARATDTPEYTRRISAAGGFRSITFVPLIHENSGIGTIILTHAKAGFSFSEKQLALLQTFADQAVIAIENVRLYNETREALQQQTATSDVLKSISRSAFDLESVLQTLSESARRLLRTDTANIYLRDGDVLRVRAHAGMTEEFHKFLQERPAKAERGRFIGRAFLTADIVHLPDVLADPEYNFPGAPQLGGFRAVLGVPMVRDGRVEGVFGLGRSTPGPFSAREIELVGTFADQALIAIENTRLFNETQEALARQTATADILRVISQSPTDVQPVFDAIVLSAVRLLGCDSSFIQLCDGATFWPVAEAGLEGPRQPVTGRAPIDPEANFPSRAIITRKNLLVPDWSAIELPEHNRYIREHRGFNSAFYLPLLRDGECVGLLSFASTRANAFGDSEISLAESFRDQALIAIENTRLFNETKEALERQTATSEILKIIAGSLTNTQPVFDAIAASANRLMGGYSTTVWRYVDDMVHLAAFTPVDPSADEALRSIPPFPFSAMDYGELILQGKPVQLENTENAGPRMRDIARARGFRSLLLVPLMSNALAIGTINVTRETVGTFAEPDVQLLQTFADQAVIAVENARLFDEVQAKTCDLEESLEQQTATSEVLEVISSSPGELDPVFGKMLENATRVCGATFGIMNLWDGETFRTAASYNVPPAFAALRQATPIVRPLPQGALHSVVTKRQVVHIHDVRTSPGYLARIPNAVEMADVAGARTVVIVPMLKEGELVGVMTIFRQEVRPFTEKQIALVRNFTKQAVIAIENTRLLGELRERTDALTRSIDELRSAQDRLVQTEKLASLGQLTAGIAHEIKNPLNFVNNFSALSAELTDELNDVLKPVVMDGKVRADVDELTSLLKDNLEKVVQHGKRADSIVKNMLLHSREGSGEQRPANINALLDESLNLAYHGARAEKPQFNITLRRDLDPDAGAVDVFPQEITRAFINLISNGFYAANKHKTENGDPDFEPVLGVATRNLGSHVEIRIRDNGTGIPAEVKEKIFNPFFTTKPAGEGTGLGLSMSHDIVVKQHGGRIEVDTQPGQFTEFKIVLPRQTIIRK